MLQLCLQTLSTKVERGKTITTRASSYNKSDYSAVQKLLTLRSPIDEQLFTIDNTARMPLARELQEIFSENAGRGQGMTYQSRDAVQSLLDQNFQDPCRQAAIAMTNAFRTTSATKDAPPVRGTTQGETVFISVKWAWLVLPISLDGLAAIFLVAVIWRTRSRRLVCWKSESIPVMRALSETAAVELVGLQRASDPEIVAEKLNVILKHDGQAWGLERQQF
jgi:hypothetical protein